MIEANSTPSWHDVQYSPGLASYFGGLVRLQRIPEMISFVYHWFRFFGSFQGFLAPDSSFRLVITRLIQ
jgi:hypothetical protein